ncbi:putative ribonuclease H-like domain-containing protein [Tanacetum coccineum]
MEYYLAHTDYPIWEVIQRGNGPVSVSTDTNGVIKVLHPKTAEEILARERERKARTTLLMALPEDHLAKLHKMTDAKQMWEAIKSRFGGNDESKKMQNQLEIHGACISTEDANQKFLRDFESDVKGSTASSSSTQNVEFVSENTSSTNEVSTAYGASSSSGHNPQRESSSSYADELTFSFFANQSSGPQLDHKDLEQLHQEGALCTITTKGAFDLEFNTSKGCVLFIAAGGLRLAWVNPRRGLRLGGSQPTTRVRRVESQADKDSLVRGVGTAGGKFVGLAVETAARGKGMSGLVLTTEKGAFGLGLTAAGAAFGGNTTGEEEMDLKWQVAMISIRLKKFYKKTGRRLQFDAKEPVGFDKTKVECFNCHNTGHFARECRSKGNQESRRRDAGNTGYKAKDNRRRPGKQEEPKALVTLDGDGVDWTGHAEDEQENFALMAYSNSGSNTEREQLGDASIEIQAYTQALKKVEAQLVAHQQNQLWYKEKIRFMKIDLDDKTDVLTYHKKLLAEAEKEKEELKAKVEKWHNSSKSLNILLNSQMSARDKAGIGYGDQMNKGVLVMHMTGNKAYLVEYQDYNGGPVAFGGSKCYITGKGKIKTGKLDFKDVCFVKELQHFNLFSVSQMCDKKNKVLFTDTECLVLSSDFKLPDENQVLLRVSRQNNMYSFNLENIIPTGGLRLLIAKATLDESNKCIGRMFDGKSEMVLGKGPNWLFDLDYLTDSMNYQPVRSENQANKHAGLKEANHSVVKSSEAKNKDLPYRKKAIGTKWVLEIRRMKEVLWLRNSKVGCLGDIGRGKDRTMMRVDTEEELLDKDFFIKKDKNDILNPKKFDFASVKTASTSIETQKPLVKDEEATDVDVHIYRSMISSLMYLTASRPDIMFAVCACSRFQVTLKTSHLNTVKRIFRYLKGKPKLGLWYPRVSSFDLEAYSDSDYAGSNLDRKSTTGGCQFLGRRLISWQCKKQTIVATSTIEAEYVAAANCYGQVLWIQNQMLDYGFNFMNTKIYIDNESTICIVKNPVFHSKTKHIEIRHHFIRDAYEKKLIQVLKIHTDDNVADLLTKAFDVSSEQKDLDNGNVTPLFNSMLVQPTEDKGEVSERPYESQPIPSPTHPSKDQPESQPDPSPRPSSSIPIHDSNPEGSSGNHGGQSYSDRSLSGNEDGLTLQSVYDLCISLCKQVTAQAVEIKILKAQIKQLKKKARPVINHHKAWFRAARLKKQQKKKDMENQRREGVYLNRGGKLSILPKDYTLAQDKGKIDFKVKEPKTSSKTEELHLSGDTLVIKDKGSAENGGSTKDIDLQQSTVKPDEGTDKQNGGTDRTKVSTDSFVEGTAEIKDQVSGESDTPTVPTMTSTPTPIVFADDETIAQVLVIMSQNKINPKAKGKGMIKEEDESDTESEDITEAKKKFKMLANEEEMVRKVQEEWEAEEEKERLAEEEATKAAFTNAEKFTIEERAKLLHDTIAAQRKFLAQQRSEVIKNKLPSRIQLRNQMMTYLKHVGGKKHSDLKTKNFEEIQVLYEKVKRSDENFIAIGSVEDEKLMKDLNKKAANIKKADSIKEESKEEEDDLSAIYQLVMDIYQDEIPEGFDSSYFELHGSSWVHTLMTEEGLVIHMLVEKKYPLRKKVLLQMLELKLESKKDSTMALELIRFVKEVNCRVGKPKNSMHGIVKSNTVFGKDKSNLLIVDSLLKTIRFSIHLVVYNEELAIPEQTATGKGTSNPLMAGSLPKTTKPT